VLPNPDHPQERQSAAVHTRVGVLEVGWSTFKGTHLCNTGILTLCAHACVCACVLEMRRGPSLHLQLVCTRGITLIFLHTSLDGRIAVRLCECA